MRGTSATLPSALLALVCLLGTAGCKVMIVGARNPDGNLQLQTPEPLLGAASWIGAHGLPVRWGSGSVPTGSSLDESVSGPSVVDGNGNLYVSANASIRRYTASTGAFTGWIGKIATSPTGGDPGCAGAAAGSATPGWCTGGSAQADIDDGAFKSILALALDSSGLYVLDMGRLSKFSLATGAFVGWTGKIASSPTGGQSGCAGAAVGSITPGWCRGGSASQVAGTGEGVLYFVSVIAVNASGVYVAQPFENKISKFDPTTGAYLGWIGTVATTPTGGQSGCASAVPGTVTPGWCVGGTPNAGSPGGGPVFANVNGLAADASGNLYATADSIITSKFNAATGAFIGWSGPIGTSPTGGDPGCAGAPAGTYTPGWCTGGGYDSLSNRRPTSKGIALDATYLYLFGDTVFLRYKISDGTPQGWIGIVATSPTGGDPGCAGAPVGAFTPGWCVGGSAAAASDADGGFQGWGWSNQKGPSLDPATGKLFAPDIGHARMNRYDAATGATQGYLGATPQAYSGWTSAQGQGGPVSGPSDGMFLGAYGMAIAGSTLYVADSDSGGPTGNQARIMKFDLASGAFGGWIGRIATTPSGGALGCASAAIGSATPGWCLGGSSQRGSDDGALSRPNQLALSANGALLYVLDSGNSRISKYDAVSGAFLGWIGNIATSPTGGDPGCAGAPAGFTPGWCLGGTSVAATYPGLSGSAGSLYLDELNVLYVGDSNRIGRYNAATGAATGWIGKIGATSPTGGDPSCNGAPSGTVTPGWCLGGSHASGSGDGMFFGLRGIAKSGSSLYAVDGNGRISRLDAATGLFTGWVGKIATSPTGGANGCPGAGAGTFTPGWCLGGTAAVGKGDGALTSPNSLFEDGKGNLYVADTNNYRVSRYDTATGAFTGWLGAIGTAPTSGAACAAAPLGSVAPNWCKGGTATYSTLNGAFSLPSFVIVDRTGTIYVADMGAARVVRILPR